MYHHIIKLISRMASPHGKSSSTSRRPSRRVAFHAGIEGLEGRAIPSNMMVGTVVHTSSYTITPPVYGESPDMPTYPGSGYPGPGSSSPDSSHTTTYPGANS